MKLLDGRHHVGCFQVKPAWRRRSAKESAGRQDNFVLKQADGRLLEPGTSAPADGHLVSLSNMAGSSDYAQKCNKIGELVLAYRAPKDGEKLANGDPKHICYKWPD